jgi:hypothetical protein
VPDADAPVSWFMIEPGWEVLDREGERVGRVEETTGDSTHDIFDGLSIAPGVFGAARYVLGPSREPPTSARVEPRQASLLERAETPLGAARHSGAGRRWRGLLVRLRTLLRLPVQ